MPACRVPTGGRALISVIIATHGRETPALRAIRSVAADASAGYEILVVDQARGGKLGTLITETFGRVGWIRYFTVDRTGLSYARNYGVARARGAAVAFLDDDAVVSPGWLAAYAAAFDAQAVMAGGRILPKWEAGLPRWYPPSRVYLLGLCDEGNALIPFPIQHLPGGANFAIRADALARLGGFSEELGFRTGSAWALAGEDSLIGARVREAGGLILYQPDAIATHRIRKEKLRFGFFLRRHVVEGRTQIEVAIRSRARTRVWLVVALARYSVDAMRAALDWLRSLVRDRAPRQSTAAFLALLALSAGALYQCARRLLGATAPSP